MNSPSDIVGSSQAIALIRPFTLFYLYYSFIYWNVRKVLAMKLMSLMVF